MVREVFGQNSGTHKGLLPIRRIRAEAPKEVTLVRRSLDNERNTIVRRSIDLAGRAMDSGAPGRASIDKARRSLDMQRYVTYPLPDPQHSLDAVPYAYLRIPFTVYSVMYVGIPFS